LEARESTWWVLLARKATFGSHPQARSAEHLDSTPQNGLTFLAPLNGITYLEGFRTLNSFGFLALCTITPVLCTGLGYGLGAISCTARFTASMNSRQLTAVLK
jgi:hypothetical protein